MIGLHKLAYRGSAIAALAFLVLAPACGEDGNADDDDAGEGGDGGTAGSGGGKAGATSGGSSGKAGGSTGGSGGKAGGSTGGTGGKAGGGSGGTTGGTTSEAGADQGGAGGEPTSQGGAAGDPGTPGGAAGAGGDGSELTVAKFCNTLSFGTEEDPQPITMILEIGEGSSKVTFTALSDTCAPPDGDACIEIPSGPGVRVSLFDADAPDTALDSSTTTIPAGTESIFYSELDEETDPENPAPVWQGFGLESSESCQGFVYDDLFQ